MTDGPAPRGIELRRYTDSAGTMRFVSLEPLAVGEAPNLFAERVHLSVGALYAAPGEGHEGEHTLALILTTVTRGGRALLADGRDLLLDVDGTHITSNPRPGGLIYTVAGTRKGIEETVMVPLTPALLREVVEAHLVMGRLGDWFTFVLPDVHRRGLARILDEIPRDASFKAEAPLRAIVASAVN
ncbi:MAG TPA: hypothetical protein VGA70_00710 [Longimicrobiales bacterium]|jgi:hypothetical protein